MKGKVIVILSFILLFMVSGLVYGDISADERAALIALYNSTNGDNWKDNSGWKMPPLHTDGFAMPGTEKDWYGVYCDQSNTMVVRIRLSENGLVGEIPAELGNLPNLFYLSLRGNQIGKNRMGETIKSEIPSELGNLKNLKELYLHRNFLNGSIPKELGELSELKILYLIENKLSGMIPSELGDLSNLELLYLHKNQLTGEIPPELGNLNSLTVLSLRSNQLTGGIPPELGKLEKLVNFYLYDNKLTGSIPPQLGNLSELVHLYLRVNELTGVIPSKLGDLSKLTHLLLNNNHLTGSIPPELGKLEELAVLHLNSNRLGGNIPSKITEGFNQEPEISANRSDFRRNALYTDDETVRIFLNDKQNGGEWERYQTVAPIGVTAQAISADSVKVSWRLIAYNFDPGSYNVLYSQTPGPPYIWFGATKDKTERDMEVTGLEQLTRYYFVVQTQTDPIPRPNDSLDYLYKYNENLVKSECSAEVSATTPHTDKIISGKVAEKSGEGVDEVILFFPPNEFERTKADGTYRHAVKHGWSGTVEPTKTGYNFDPDKLPLPPVISHRTGINFKATKIPLAISGNVMDAFGDGVEGVTLTFTSYNGGTEIEITNSNGYYSHPVNYGWFGKVTPSKDDFVFDPSYKNYLGGVKESKDGENYHLGITLTLTASLHEERTFIMIKNYAKVNLTAFVREVQESQVDRYIIYRKRSDDVYREIVTILASELQEGTPITFENRYLEKNVPYTYQAKALEAGGRVIGKSVPVTIGR